MDQTRRDGGEGWLERTTVLLVEDDASTREVLAALLSRYGASVVSTDSVADALCQLDALQPSVLISDIGLPDDDGYTLIDRVRRREGRSLQHLPALAISGYGGDVDERARAAGFDAFLAKPIDTGALLQWLCALPLSARHSS